MLLLVIGLILTPLVASNTVTTEISETTPIRVEQGDTATIYVRVTNTGEDIQESIDITVTPPVGVRLIREDQRVTTIDSLGGLQDIVIPYEVYIEDDAPTGTLSLTTKIRQGDSVKTRTLPLSVNKPAEQLEVRTISVSPTSMQPGSQGTLTIQIANQGKSTIRNLNMELLVEETPLRPVGQSNVLSIPRLNSEETRSISLPIITPPVTESGLYDIPLDISYALDTVGDIQKKYVGSYIVDSEPIISASFDTTDAKVNQEGTTQFTVVNSGLSDIKRLKATFTPVAGVDTAPYDVYIGDLSADDFDIVSKDITPLEKSIAYNVTLSYFTTTNEERTQTERVSFTVEEETSTSFIPLLLGIVLVGTGIVWWRRRE